MKYLDLLLLFIFGVIALRAQGERRSSLSETGLYTNILEKTISKKNFEFSPQYPLWTDGAQKRRHLYLPPNSRINTRDINRWEFPAGTKFWKEFSFPLPNGTLKRVETRLSEKKMDGTWEFSTYLWDENESEASLAPAQGIKEYFRTSSTTTHDIPGQAMCLRCHRRGGDLVLGFDVLQLSTDRDGLAPHSEVLPLNALTLKELVERELISDVPPNVLSHPPRIHSESPQGRAVMGYLHGNCGHCHNPEGPAGFTDLHLRHVFEASSQIQEPAFASSVGQMTTGFTLPGESESFRIKPQDPEKSAIHFRMSSIERSRMPPLGTKQADEAAITLLIQWIHQLSRTNP